MNEQLIKFKGYLEANRLSLTYLSYLKVFIDFLDKNKISLDCVQRDTLTQFLQEKKDWKTTTINIWINAGRKFFEFLYPGKDNPFKQIKAMRVERKMKDYLTLEELQKGITYISSELRVNPAQVKALFLFMIYTGLRVGEVLNAKREDFDFIENSVLVRTPNKGKQERIVYFPKKIGLIIQHYFSGEGQENNAFNVTEPQIRYWTTNMNKLFPTKKLSPHSMRHGYCKNLLREGGSLEIVQQQMGHASILTTQVYAQADDATAKRRLQEIFDKRRKKDE